jgi:Gas vesicle synthesis protein GvpL/GvpF
VIEVYAITDHPAPPLPSVENTVLGAARAGALAAVWAVVDDERAVVTIDGLRRHEAIVEALMADRDLLPVRYGTRVPDVATAARLLIEQRDDLSRALAQVRGSVEVALRVVAASGADADPARALTSVHRPLAARARAARCRPRAGGDLLRGAYLVTRDEVDAFAGAVAELQESVDDLRLLCTGPWPPYSFAQR